MCDICYWLYAVTYSWGWTYKPKTFYIVWRQPRNKYVLKDSKRRVNIKKLTEIKFQGGKLFWNIKALARALL